MRNQARRNSDALRLARGVGARSRSPFRFPLVAAGRLSNPSEERDAASRRRRSVSGRYQPSFAVLLLGGDSARASRRGASLVRRTVRRTVSDEERNTVGSVGFGELLGPRCAGLPLCGASGRMGCGLGRHVRPGFFSRSSGCPSAPGKLVVGEHPPMDGRSCAQNRGGVGPPGVRPFSFSRGVRPFRRGCRGHGGSSPHWSFSGGAYRPPRPRKLAERVYSSLSGSGWSGRDAFPCVDSCAALRTTLDGGRLRSQGGVSCLRVGAPFLERLRVASGTFPADASGPAFGIGRGVSENFLRNVRRSGAARRKGVKVCFENRPSSRKRRRRSGAT